MEKRLIREVPKVALLLLMAGIAGWVFERIGSPLPWMIGPLVFTAVLFMWGRFNLSVPNSLRPFGQVVVATQVGLVFSPEVFRLLLDLAPVIIGTALMTGVVIFGVAIVLSKTSQMTLAQAFLASVPTSPVEAAAMAVRAGVDPMPVIFSQTLRLSAVVVILPFTMYALEGWPEINRAYVAIEPFQLFDVLLTATLAIAAMYVFRLARVPNPNFLGPLTLMAGLSVTGMAPLPFPTFVLALAQIILGVWLGSTFKRSLLTSAGRLSIACALSILLVLALCSVGAIGIAAVSGIDWHTTVLGAAPGGVVEMALTAKFLGQNVALITAFHLARIFLFMPNIPWVVRLISRHEQKLKLGRDHS